METIRNYLETMFRNMPNTPEVRRMMETNRIPFDFTKDICRLIRKIDAEAFKRLFRETVTA